MKFSVYAIRDSLIGFSFPMVRDNDAVAKRAFEYDFTRSDSPYSVHAGDFDLYRIGAYESDTGSMIPEDPTFICSASDFVKEK